LFLRYICREHPRFKTNQTIEAGSLWHSIEGGDVLMLNRHVMAIGLSQRTNPHAIETFCDDLFFGHAYQQYHNLKSVLVFHIPEKRAFMHLDTILTQLDNDKFAIHAEAARQMVIYELTPGQIVGKLKCRKLEGSLHYILSHYMGQSVTLINCGGGDQITGSREQWSDAANTLAINPGEVLVYQRNQITNRILEQHGITVHPLPCSELSRGRGGPRCMSMPLVRQSQR
jgi:arginine deiminase